MTYVKVNADGSKVYSSCKVIELNGVWISNPTADKIAEAGWTEVSNIVNEPSEEDKQSEEYQQMLADSEAKMMSLIEKYFAENGEGELKDVASERQQIRYILDSLGKIEQTTEGTGTAFDPYKTWTEGTEVKEGDWWITDDNHIWQAIKSGVPSSSTDAEYWDITE